ncbi:hypothetical protein ASG81_08190 [Paenibacillus sp. Soil522]|nr:hypothetical protein ASG81_08190 [Paenibacillus sp. Soil522]
MCEAEIADLTSLDKGHSCFPDPPIFSKRKIVLYSLFFEQNAILKYDVIFLKFDNIFLYTKIT